MFNSELSEILKRRSRIANEMEVIGNQNSITVKKPAQDLEKKEPQGVLPSKTLQPSNTKTDSASMQLSSTNAMASSKQAPLIQSSSKVNEDSGLAASISKLDPQAKIEGPPLKKEDPPAPLKKEEPPVKKEEPPQKKEEPPQKKEEPPVKKEEFTNAKKELEALMGGASASKPEVKAQQPPQQPQQSIQPAGNNKISTNDNKIFSPAPPKLDLQVDLEPINLIQNLSASKQEVKVEEPVKKNLLEESKTLGANKAQPDTQKTDSNNKENAAITIESDFKYNAVGMKFQGDPNNKAPSETKFNKTYPTILNGTSLNQEPIFFARKAKLARGLDYALENEKNRSGKDLVDERLREWNKLNNKGGQSNNPQDSPIPQKKEIDMASYDASIEKIRKKMDEFAMNQHYEECIPLRNQMEKLEALKNDINKEKSEDIKNRKIEELYTLMASI